MRGVGTKLRGASAPKSRGAEQRRPQGAKGTVPPQSFARDPKNALPLIQNFKKFRCTLLIHLKSKQESFLNIKTPPQLSIHYFH